MTLEGKRYASPTFSGGAELNAERCGWSSGQLESRGWRAGGVVRSTRLAPPPARQPARLLYYHVVVLKKGSFCISAGLVNSLSLCIVACGWATIGVVILWLSTDHTRKVARGSEGVFVTLHAGK